MFIGLSAFNITGFNRTFMELKLPRLIACSILALSFNRTFMELKLNERLIIFCYHDSFNRTFMELKFSCFSV